MALPNLTLIAAIRKTIYKLQNGANYQWGHMGACNCGNLAQELTKLSKSEIHQYAMQKRGNWNEQVMEFCPNSGFPMDLMISKMLEAGLSKDDLMHLEKLSDPLVLKTITKDKRDQLQKNCKEDLILYMQCWVKILEDQWAASIKIQPSQNSSEIKAVLC